MTPSLLADVGRALYGTLWQSALSRDLGVSDRTMRRWLASTRPLPAGVSDDLLRLCYERIATLQYVRRKLIEADLP